MNCRRLLCWTLASLLMLLPTASVFAAEPATAIEPSTMVPVPREGAWLERHEKINERAKQGDVDLLFIGDSITQGWADNEVWQKRYGKRKAMNAGIGGDRTQHVLWRLENGNIDNISPKLAVLMIGTNNAGADTSEDIAAGVKAIVEKLRKELPETKVLILGIFPRGPDNDNQHRKVNAGANRIIAELADGEMVAYKDIGDAFLADDGTLSKEIMPDLLHLSIAGYQIWADSIEEEVAAALKE